MIALIIVRSIGTPDRRSRKKQIRYNGGKKE
jgi:hypothetical protein